MDEDSINMDLGFQTGRDWVLVFCTKNKDSVSLINKYFHNLSSNILFQYSKIYSFRGLSKRQNQSIFWKRILLSFKLAFSHRRRKIFNKTYEICCQVFLKGIKLHFILLLKKKDHQCHLKRMKVYRN